MTNDFVPVRLADVLDIVTSKVDVSEINVESYISTDNMRTDFGGVEKAESLPSVNKVSEYESGDILFSNIRTYFKKLWFANREGGCSNDVIVFRAKENVYPKFAFYSLMNEAFISHTVQTSKGTKMPRGDKAAIKQYEMVIPGIKEQIAIADLLSAFDDKIELNRQMNETLEAMEQALFKSWFVDFDPVIDNALAAGNEIPEPVQERAAARQALGDQRKPLPSKIQAKFPSSFVFTDEMGWIPEGWEVVELSAVTTELRRGISPKYTETGGVRVVNQKCIRNHLIDFSLTRRNDPALRKIDGREICVGDVLVNSTGVGTLGRMAQVLNLDEVTVVDSHVTVVRADPKAFKPSVFGLMMLNLEPTVEAMGEGSTGQTELSRANLQAMKVVQPSPHLQESLEQILQNFAARKVVISNENDVLSRTRDTLLPKLLSGELRVKNAEPKVAEAL